MTTADLAEQIGLTYEAVRLKRKKGMTDAAIIKQAEARQKLQDSGGKNTSDKGGQQAGVAKSFYAARAAELKPKVEASVVVPLIKGKRPEPDEQMFNAQWRKEIALADLKDLEVAQKRGELIPIVQVQSWVVNCIVRAREVWMGLRDLADRIRQEPDVIKAQQLVDDEVRRGLEELEKFGVLSSGGEGGRRINDVGTPHP